MTTELSDEDKTFFKEKLKEKVDNDKIKSTDAEKIVDEGVVELLKG